MKQYKPISVRLPLDLDVRVEEARRAQGQTKEQWVIAAISKALQDEGFKPGEVGIMAGVAMEDHIRVRRLVAFLREAPRGLKDAADLAMRVLDKALAEARRESDK